MKYPLPFFALIAGLALAVAKSKGKRQEELFE
jgi:hypothetical protein